MTRGLDLGPDTLFEFSKEPMNLFYLFIFIGFIFRFIFIIYPMFNLVRSVENKPEKIKKMKKDIRDLGKEIEGIGTKYKAIIFVFFLEVVVSILPLSISLFMRFLAPKPNMTYVGLNTFVFVLFMLIWLYWIFYDSKNVRNDIKTVQLIMTKKHLFRTKWDWYGTGIRTTTNSRKLLKKVSELDEPEFREIDELDLMKITKEENGESKFDKEAALHNSKQVLQKIGTLLHNSGVYAKQIAIDGSKKAVDTIDKKVHQKIDEQLESAHNNFWKKNFLRLFFELFPVIAVYGILTLVR